MKDLSNENVVHINKDGIQYLQFRKLLEYGNVITHAYSIGTNVNFRTARVNKQQLPVQEFKKAMQDYENLCKAITYCLIIVGIAFTIMYILMGIYMKTRVGLKPEEYSKEERKYDVLKEDI